MRELNSYIWKTFLKKKKEAILTIEESSPKKVDKR